MMQWISATRATYIGNATAIRDYRTQLRGTKAFWLWGAYLALLIAICGLAYNQFADQGSQSISRLQEQLTTFYHTIIGMLGGVVILVAPGLTAASITTERQRRSLDLIFSAPVRPRYLLVGKMIAGMRYLLMLLILALPVVSVCVVMGGATWTDVLGSFINLMNAGIVMLAIGLLMSSIVPTNIGAILASYAVIAIYTIFTTGLGAATSIGRIVGMGGSNSYEAPWYGNIVPFAASVSAPTFTKVGDFELPNWVIGLLYSLLVCKVLLAGAGSALSPFGSSETKSLRVHGLLAAFAVMFLIAGPVAGGLAASITTSLVGAGVSGSRGSEAVAAFLGVATVSTFFLWPHLMCHSREGERKFWNDGLLSIKGAFRGTPSGSWVYSMLLIVMFAAGLYAGVSYFANSSFVTSMIASAAPSAVAMPPSPGGPGMAPVPMTPTPSSAFVGPTSIMSDLGVPFLTMLLWCMGFVTLWWGIARYTSATAGNLKGARLGLVSAMVVLVAIPTPIFSVIAASNWNYGGAGTDPIWKLHIMYPMFSQNAQDSQGFYGLGCAVVGFILAFLGEKKYRAKYPVTENV